MTRKKESLTCPSIYQALSLGIALGFMAALASIYLVVAHAVAINSLAILRWHEGDLLAVLVANAADPIVHPGWLVLVLYPGSIAGLVEAIAMALTYALSRAVNRGRSGWQGAVIGLGVSAAVILGIHLLFYGRPVVSVRLAGWDRIYVELVELPSLLAVAMTAWAGWRIRFGPAQARSVG